VPARWQYDMYSQSSHRNGTAGFPNRPHFQDQHIELSFTMDANMWGHLKEKEGRSHGLKLAALPNIHTNITWHYSKVVRKL